MILAGELSLWIALLMAGWATTVSFAGAYERRADLVRSGERALVATFVFTLVATLGLWTALVTHEFSLKYVASYSSENLPTLYLITSLWAGTAGALLFVTLLFTKVASIAVLTTRRTHRDLSPWMTGTLGAGALCLLVSLCFSINPYQRLTFLPPDGQGLNPELQNPGMALYPPLLYLGLVGTAIPFALAMGAMMARSVNAAWMHTARRWALLAWFFLTVGSVLGMRWAYHEVAWAGFWNWDSAQSASLLPWLTATAFLHTAVVQERLGVLRKWNVMLIVATFMLSVMAAFLARSGLADSSYRFAQSNGWLSIGVLLIVVAVASGYLMRTRLAVDSAETSSPAVTSREMALLSSNLPLLGLCFATLWGTLFPLLSQAVLHQSSTVSAPWFDAVNGALALLLLAHMGVAPLLAWRRTSVDRLRSLLFWPWVAALASAIAQWVLGFRNVYAFAMFALAAFLVGVIVRECVAGVIAQRRLAGTSLATSALQLLLGNRQRYGGYVTHIGMTLVLCAFVGQLFERDIHASLKTGDAAKAVDAFGHTWTFTSQGTSRFEVLNRSVVSMTVDAARDGHRRGFLTSEKRQYLDGRGEPVFDPSTEIGLLSSLAQDVVLVFTGSSDVDTVDIHITFHPLVGWLWWGGVIVAIGGLVVMWPSSRHGAS